MRALRFTLALIVAVLAGVAGASAVVGTTGQDTAGGDAAVQPDGSGAAIAATTADPAGGGRRWAVRVYRSEAGLTCSEPGRTVDGDFGRVDGDGTFHPNSLQAAGSCADLGQEPYSLLVAHFPADRDRGARDIVYGAVTAAVKSVTVATPDGAKHAVPLTNGSYVLALAAADGAGADVAVTLSDGTTAHRTLEHRPPPTATASDR
jgi:hypothetical protein